MKGDTYHSVIHIIQFVDNDNHWNWGQSVRIPSGGSVPKRVSSPQDSYKLIRNIIGSGTLFLYTAASKKVYLRASTLNERLLGLVLFNVHPTSIYAPMTLCLFPVGNAGDWILMFRRNVKVLVPIICVK